MGRASAPGLALGSLTFALGAAAYLGCGRWLGLRSIGGRGILDAVGFAAANILPSLKGLLLVVFLDWGCVTVPIC